MKNDTIHPRNAKVDVAKKIVAQYHNQEAGEAALEEFERVFKKKDIPDDIPETALGQDTINLIDAIATTKLVPSKKEGRRMIQQNAVSLNGEKVTDPYLSIDLSEKQLLKVGKRKFMYIIK